MLRVIPITRSGELDFEAFLALHRRAHAAGRARARVERARHGGAGGALHPRGAHARGIPVLLDGAQAVPHLPVDVQALDCDFYCFSGHKMYGPTGIGVL